MREIFKIIEKESDTDECLETAKVLEKYITGCIAKSSNLQDIAGQNSPETSLLLPDVMDLIETLQRCVDYCILKYVKQMFAGEEKCNNSPIDEEFINLTTILKNCVIACIENSPSKHEFIKTSNNSRNCDETSVLESCTKPTCASNTKTPIQNEAALQLGGSMLNCETVLSPSGSTPHCEDNTFQLSKSSSDCDETSLQLSDSVGDCSLTVLQSCGSIQNFDEKTLLQSDSLSDSDKTTLQPNCVQSEEGILCYGERPSALQTSVKNSTAENDFTQTYVVPQYYKEPSLDHMYSEQENKTSQNGSKTNKGPIHCDEFSRNKDAIQTSGATNNKVSAIERVTTEKSEKTDARLMQLSTMTPVSPRFAKIQTEQGASQVNHDSTSVSYPNDKASTAHTTALHSLKDNSNFFDSTHTAESEINSVANSQKSLMSLQTNTLQTFEEGSDAQKLQIAHSSSEGIIAANVDTVCDEVCNNRTGLHRKGLTIQQLFTCGVCRMQFPKASSYLVHRKKHEEDKHTFNLNDFVLYKREREFKCDLCDKAFWTAKAFTRHKNIHIRTQSLKCSICGKQFNKVSNFKIHKRVHTKERPYQCDFCEKTYTLMSTMKRHRFLHTDKKTHTCNICGKAFSLMHYLSNHKKLHDTDFLFQCEICGKCFKYKQVLISHKKCHKDKGTRTRKFDTVCDICGKKLASYDNLRRHKSTHTRPYQCDTCGKTFGQSNALKYHIMSHRGEWPYVCDICGKGFKTKKNLSEHKMVYHFGKKFECDICQKTFSNSQTLRKHKRLHTIVRLFECNICQKTFSHSHSLRQHKRLHTIVGKQHQCNICGKKFKSKTGLNYHLKRHANNKTSTIET